MIELTQTEVGSYYRYRVPLLRQSESKTWRGRCPIHQGDGANFTVQPETGRWFCFSRCGRGGDVLALEKALTGASFAEAKRAIFAIVGRADGDVPGSEHRPTAKQFRHDRADAEQARSWQRGAILSRDQYLAVLKSELARETEPPPEIERAIYQTERAKREIAMLRGEALLSRFREDRNRWPGLTQQLVSAGREDDRNTAHWTRCIVRLIEQAEIGGGDERIAA